MPTSDKAVRYGRGQAEQDERAADGESIAVGTLLERTANGVASHSTAAGMPVPYAIAIGARGRGMELGDSYADGELVRYLVVGEGVGIHVRLAGGSNLATASNANITDGDKLVSNGDGTYRKLDTSLSGETEDDAIAAAEESLDNSGSSSATPLAVQTA